MVPKEWRTDAKRGREIYLYGYKNLPRRWSNHRRLQGKVAIITGAGSRIGEAIAHNFAKGGARVVVCGSPDAVCAPPLHRIFSFR
jgi:3-oxoacyl-ACP reductase-like protein